MTKRTVMLSLSLGVLAIGLAALPGSSARAQNPDPPTTEPLQATLASLELRTQQESDKPSTRVQVLNHLQELEELQAPGEDGFELVIGNGGSWLGVETKEVSAENVQRLKLPAERGALLGKIIPDSPAAKAGLKENDVITEINGQRVEGTAQFRRMIRETPAGRAAQLTLFRDGRSQTISVTLGKSEARNELRKLRAPSPGAFAFLAPEATEIPEVMDLGDLNNFAVSALGKPRLGIDAEDLQGELGAYFGAPDGQGVLVRGVHPDSPAAKAGLKSGDVITNLNGQRIRTIHELREQLRSQKDESVKLGLLRNKSELSLNVVLPVPMKKEIHTPSERTTM